MILRADELDTAQNAFELLKTLAWFLPLLTLAAFALAVWLAEDRRRAIRGGLCHARGRRHPRICWRRISPGTTSSTRWWRARTTGRRRTTRGTSSPSSCAGRSGLLVVVGILFVVAAWLAGPGRRALTRADGSRPRPQNRVWAYVVLAVVGLFLLLNAQVADFTRVLVVLLIAALGADLDRARAEADARGVPGHGRLDVVADARARMTSWWERGASERRRAACGFGAAARPTSQLGSRALPISTRVAP